MLAKPVVGTIKENLFNVCLYGEDNFARLGEVNLHTKIIMNLSPGDAQWCLLPKWLLELMHHIIHNGCQGQHETI